MKRSELHAAVWARPSSEVARQCGVSDTWLRKVSRRYNVPVPPRGHWQKVHAGHQVQTVPLPEGEDVDVDLNERPAGAGASTAPGDAAAGGEAARTRCDGRSTSARRDVAAAMAILERHARQALIHRAMERMLADLTATLLMGRELDACDRREWLLLLHEQVRLRAPRSETIERVMKPFGRPRRLLR